MRHAANQNRTKRSGATETLTLRLTTADRLALDALVAAAAKAMADTGSKVTAASYVRGLIRREARAKALL